jgi:hypothetical protein
VSPARGVRIRAIKIIHRFSPRRFLLTPLICRRSGVTSGFCLRGERPGRPGRGPMCGDGRGKKVGWPPPLGMVGEATKRASRGVTIPDVFPSHPRVCVSRTLGPAAGMFRRSPDLPHPVRVRALENNVVERRVFGFLRASVLSPMKFIADSRFHVRVSVSTFRSDR